MDRNFKLTCYSDTCFVALRKESVDRNNDDFSVESGEMVSLSARRAWIEILVLCASCIIVGSLSARRAWIEINWS